MNILIIVKATGENFIRHYYPGIPWNGISIAHSPDQAIKKLWRMRYDVVILEWANDLTALMTKSPQFKEARKKDKFKVVVRVHDHEVTNIRPDGTRRYESVNWDIVDMVWFINRQVEAQFNLLTGGRHRTFFLPNAIDDRYFTLAKKEQRKVGLLSLYFRPRKNIPAAIEIARLCPDWEFIIRVEIPIPGQEFYREYSELLMKYPEGIDNVLFENRNVAQVVLDEYHPKEVNQWMQDKAIVLSSSTHEGFHYAIAEGALTGARPVVLPWPTATDFWQPFVVTNIEEAAKVIRTHEFGQEQKYRQYVRDRYSPQILGAKLRQHLKMLFT